MRTTLIIPCYDEAEGIPQLCQRLSTLVEDLSRDGELEIVFVDDGSTDATAAVIAERAAGLPYRLVSHQRNRGLGAALRTGFAASRGREIVTLDSDCTYDPAQVPALLSKLRAGADVVTASPYHPMGEVVGVEPWRLVLSKSLSRLYWLVLPVHLHTYTSCFRAYRREVLASLHAPDNGFLAVTQLLVSAILSGARVIELPARLTTRRYGHSKIRVLQVSLSHLRYLLRMSLRSFLGAPNVSPDEATVTPTSHEGNSR